MGKEAEKRINWTAITSLLVTVILASITVFNFFDSRSRNITIHNKLGFPIKIYTNGDFRGQISAYSKAYFDFYSNSDFPVQVNWETLQQKDSGGNLIGDKMTGLIKHVDNHADVSVQNVYGANYYFMPILTNSTVLKCTINVNEKYVGILNPFASKINVGYYEWNTSSNVILECTDGKKHSWGINGTNASSVLKVNSPDGATYITLTYK